MSNVQNPTKVNEHRVKISAGYVAINKPLAVNQSVTLVIQGDVTKSEDSSTGIDGEVDRTYTVKGIVTKVVEIDGKVIFEENV